MKALITILVLSIFTGCASYQEGQGAYVVKGKHPKGTPIKGYIDDGFSTKYYTLIQVSFGNEKANWKRIKKVRADFNDKKLNKKIKIVIGSDLSTWADSIKHKRAIDAHNRAVLLGSLAIAGAAVTASGNNHDTRLAGAAVYATSLGAMGVNDFMNKTNALNRAKLIPRGHLYEPFAIPAGLVTKRWILLESDSEIIPNDIYLNVTYQNKQTVRYRLPIKSQQF